MAVDIKRYRCDGCGWHILASMAVACPHCDDGVVRRDRKVGVVDGSMEER